LRGARGMLRVDPEPFESLTAPREIEGRLFLPRSSDRGLRVVEGSTGHHAVVWGNKMTEPVDISCSFMYFQGKCSTFLKLAGGVVAPVQ
jgi:hypothetical protein